MSRWCLCALAIGIGACGGSGPTADGGAANVCPPLADGGPLPAPPTFFSDHPALQLRNNGGPILASPHLVPIFFAGDAEQAHVIELLGALGCSEYWQAVAGEYGVGPASAADPVIVADAPPALISDVEIGAWINAQIAAHVLPVPDESTLYIVYYPAQTAITQGSKHACGEFFGFHDSVQLSDGTRAAFVAIPRCPTFGGLNGTDVLTAFSSHEIIEASVDPFPAQAPALEYPDDEHIALVAFGAESADLCQAVSNFDLALAGTSLRVVRSYSNRAALAGRDPCVPASGDPFFTAAPIVSDSISLMTDLGTTITTHGVDVAPGTRGTIAIALYHEMPGEMIQLTTQDISPLLGVPPGSSTLSFDHDQGTGGETLELNVDTPASAMAGSMEIVLVTASSGGIGRAVAAVLVTH